MSFSINKLPKDRAQYLQKLVNQFCESEDKDIKLKSLANLSNFAYDVLNWSFLRELNVVDLFLDQLYTNDIEFIKLACSGLCNISLDVLSKQKIINHDGIELLFHCLNKDDENIVKNCLTTLMFLIDEDNVEEICNYELRDYLHEANESVNPCLSNLCKVFLSTYF